MGKKKIAWGPILIVGLLIAGAFMFWPQIQAAFSGVAPTAGTVSPTTQQPTSQSVALGACGDDRLADLQVRTRNVANTSTTADYTHGVTGGASVSLVDASTNSIVANYPSNSDGTYTSTANALECGKSYYMVVLNNASVGASKSDTKVVDSPIVKFDMGVVESSQIRANLYSTAFANETNTPTAFATGSQDFASVTNTAMDQNSNLALRYEVTIATSGTQFGSNERLCETKTGVCGRAFVCATGASSVYAVNDISIDGPVILGRTDSLTALCAVSAPANAGVGRTSFETTALKVGFKAGTLTITPTLAAPGDTNNVRFIWHDNAYYRCNDGTLCVGTADQGGTDTGETNNYFEADIT